MKRTSRFLSWAQALNNQVVQVLKVNAGTSLAQMDDLNALFIQVVSCICPPIVPQGLL